MEARCVASALSWPGPSVSSARRRVSTHVGLDDLADVGRKRLPANVLPVDRLAWPQRDRGPDVAVWIDVLAGESLTISARAAPIRLPVTHSKVSSARFRPSATHRVISSSPETLLDHHQFIVTWADPESLLELLI